MPENRAMPQNDANPGAALSTARAYGTDQKLDAKTDQGAAEYWSHEYNDAMKGNKNAQEEVRSAVKEWSQLPAGCNGKEQVKGMMRDLQMIDPSAAFAFNNAMVHDGYIEFTPNKR